MKVRIFTFCCVAMLACFSVVGGCGSSSGTSAPSGGPQGDAQSAGDSSLGGDTKVLPDGGLPPDLLAACTFPATLDFSPWKGCSASSDCVVRVRPSDCGEQSYVGISSAYAPTYDVCVSHYTLTSPQKGCYSQSWFTEDGKTGSAEPTAVLVACTAGKCSTYAP